MAESVAILALILDALLGWPKGLYRRIGHPVGLFARIINACARHANQPQYSGMSRRIAGVATVLLLFAITISGALVAEGVLRHLAGHFAWIGVAVLAWPALAQRSLFNHVSRVHKALAGNDLSAARAAVSMIVGRDTALLNEAGITRAAIESLAESFCDGVTAPLFWLIACGLPGIWATKAINTADSMIGHKDAQWRAFGWAAARCDDALNLVPARLAAMLICLAGGGGWKTLWRDRYRHASPNAGWSEAAMAGALCLSLAGPVSYNGVMHHHGWIGDGRKDATADDITRALRIYIRACALLWLITGAITGGIAWAL